MDRNVMDRNVIDHNVMEPGMLDASTEPACKPLAESILFYDDL
jgi:hypothetical protein